MIVTVDIATLGTRQGLAVLARPPRSERVPGLHHAETVFTAPISPRPLPLPNLATVGLIAAWEDDAARDRFESSHPLAEHLAGGWRVRLEPLRISGAWPEVPDLLDATRPVDDAEPVVVLTIGRTKPWRLPPFLRAAAAAEADALVAPGLLAKTGFGRLPRLVSTFTVWRSAGEMRDFSYRADGAHQAAVDADRAHPFHFSSAFIRFRPYASAGSWGGGDPLAEALAATA
ncbi:MAG TPA: hypothetical protein VMH33_09265 [Solirubrobacterales bacterium]|nr:hypothetical protein [Solirubrobacterales bacterium]